MSKDSGRIIHRSKYRLITDDIEGYVRKRQVELKRQKHQGLQAPSDKPYVPMGKLSNVLFVLDAVKKTIPHSGKLNYSTEKCIKMMRRNKNPTLFGSKPRRTLKILNNDESDSEDESSYSLKKQLEQKSRRLGLNHMTGYFHESKSLPKNQRYNKFVNKINTSSYIVVSSYKDGSDALKNELSLSFKRMRAAKHGHDLSNSLKRLKSEFYTPKKNQYLISRKAQLLRIMKENQDEAMHILDSGPIKSNTYWLFNLTNVFIAYLTSCIVTRDNLKVKFDTSQSNENCK